MNAPVDRFAAMVGRRAQAARREAGFTQKELSDRLGFKDRQTLANIEAGRRKVSTEELLKLMQIFGKGIEYFTDRLRLVGEGAFCWRAEADISMLDAFEDKAKAWIAAYRCLGEELGEPFSPLFPQLRLTPKNSFEDAQKAAEQLAEEWHLGERPAERLLTAVEAKLKILTLNVDPPKGISGAACHLPEFNTILANRREPDGRRVYGFAHELFHLLTWNTMPPERLDLGNPKKPSQKRIEQMANNFAAALLMPAKAVEARWQGRGRRDIHGWLNSTAQEMGVTAKALFWRIRNMRLLSEGDALAIFEDRLTWNGRVPSGRALPRLYSLPFVERLQKALAKGLISVRRAAQILDCTIEDLCKLIGDYGLKAPFDI